MNQNNSMEELKKAWLEAWEWHDDRPEHQADWWIKKLHQELQKARAEERHSLLATVKAMSWDAKNETPDAVRILKELYDLLSTSDLDQPDTH